MESLRRLRRRCHHASVPVVACGDAPATLCDAFGVAGPRIVFRVVGFADVPATLCDAVGVDGPCIAFPVDGFADAPATLCDAFGVVRRLGSGLRVFTVDVHHDAVPPLHYNAPAMAYKTLRIDHTGGVLTVTLDRPDVHNAFNDELIAEAIDLFSNIDIESTRAVVLQGTGKNFCAGADLNWMSRMVSYTKEENIRDSSELAKMYATINVCPVPVVGRIQGAAIGGGVGLVAVCDIAITTSSTVFGLSEVKLGILPAVISPYVIAKIGPSHARALFLTGERFEAERALRIGLVHRMVESVEELDAAVYETVTQLKTSGPEAVRECKKLIDHVAAHDLIDAIPYTIDAIATRRVTEEGQAGMKAFLNKELAPWASKS